MTFEKALNALKDNNFDAARSLIAAQDPAIYGFQHFLIKGLAELFLEKWAEATKTFISATEQFPSNALLWLNRGIAEENIGALDAAIESQKKCLDINPKQGEAAGNLSNLYRKQKRFAEAEAMARQALDLGASQSDALNSLGLALGKQKKFAEAGSALKQAQKAAPQNPDIILNEANLAVDQLRLEEAWPLFAAARTIVDKPVFRRDEAMARLLAGDYAQGWKLFEARLEMQGALRISPSCPRWQGESLENKKLLIVAEQGLGDVIQFCRYEKFLRDGELIWAVPKNLVRLLTGALRGNVMDETGSLPAVDYYIPIMSLPFVTKEYVCPATKPYLLADPTPLLPTGNHAKKIGLVWAGSHTHERDHERSIDLKEFVPLFHSIEADYYAPFLGERLNEITHFSVTRLDHLMNDFADTAALLKQMDCLIAVDTAIAHLAGALGVKTFLLLPYCPDWRWGVSGQTTHLYASLTILRQPTYNDWSKVIEMLVSYLRSA